MSGTVNSDYYAESQCGIRNLSKALAVSAGLPGRESNPRPVIFGPLSNQLGHKFPLTL